MNDSTDSRLQRLLGGTELTAVRERLRRHFERVESGTASATTVRLDDLDPAAHSALCQLTGQRSRLARSMTLDITELDEQLRSAGLATSLRNALEQLEGPIVAKTKLRRELQNQWTALTRSISGGLLLRAWLDEPAALTLLKRLERDPARAAPLLAAADAVLQRLPASGLTRSQLAAETLGDAHALDAGRPVATLVLAIWRHHERTTELSRDDGQGDEALSDDKHRADNNRDERQRDIWARAGVLVNELARPVLFLNLPSVSDGNCTWTTGEPGYLSLRQLLRRPLQWPVAGQKIFVCENPNVIAIAADRLGANCSPLVCTDGMPAAAQRILLDQLANAGACLCYHGDYDWPGIGICNHVMRTWRATPWRFGAGDYREAVAKTPRRPRDLGTDMVTAVWDSDLAPVMQEQGLVIAEEAVVEALLVDLVDSCE